MRYVRFALGVLCGCLASLPLALVTLNLLSGPVSDHFRRFDGGGSFSLAQQQQRLDQQRRRLDLIAQSAKMTAQDPAAKAAIDEQLKTAKERIASLEAEMAVGRRTEFWFNLFGLTISLLLASLGFRMMRRPKYA